MSKEGVPVEGARERQQQRLDAIKDFDDNLDALSNLGIPLSQSYIRPQIEGFLQKTFNDLKWAEINAIIDTLEEYECIPDEDLLYDDPEYAIEWLRTGLYDLMVDMYAMAYSQEEFNEWLEPYIVFTLAGHVNEPGHFVEACHRSDAEQKKACPGYILTSVVEDQLAGDEGSLRYQEMHLAFASESVNGNVRQMKILQKLGIIPRDEAEEVIENYQDWLDSLRDSPIPYDKAVFDSPDL